jgi:SAM-dependent methyltransferase
MLRRVGGSFYDEGEVFERYRSAVHPGPASANFVMEEPAVLEAIGDAGGLRILDLRCGDAAIGRRLLAEGCRGYVGIDASARMIEAAHAALHGTAGEARRDAIERFSAPPDSFDLVISRLALHYVEDLDAALGACRDCLSAGGRMVFTVVHPVVTSHDARAWTDEPRASWVVDDYFTAGPRRFQWLGAPVAWQHRTVGEYVASFQRAGFRLTALSECPPRAERFGDDLEELARRRRIPLFLLLAGER